MRVWREVGSGVTAAQVRRVVASTVGVGAVARRLGVAECTAHRWAGLAGVSIVPRPRTERMPGRQLVSDAAVRDAMLGPLSLRAAVERAPSAARWAQRHGVGPGYLADVLSGRRPPGAKILSALGIGRAYVRGRP